MRDTKSDKIEIVPQRFLQIIGVIVVGTLATVFFLKYIDYPKAGVPPTSVISEELILRFDSSRGRVVSVFSEDRLIARSSNDGQGFLGVVYNAVERERIKKRISSKSLLRLVSYTNGRLVLIDDSTGLQIQLNSFGLKNAEVFGQLFTNS